MNKVLRNRLLFFSKLISMGLKFLLLIMFLSALAACTSEFSSFQNEAVTFASNDNKIDEKEYNSLIDKIKVSKDASLKRFLGDDQQVDTAKLNEYLLKLFTAKKLPLTAGDIWQPSHAPTEKFNIDVYIENSASMDGYVKGVTDFETAIYNLLGDIKISEICNSLNLNYINKSVTYTKTNALPVDIQDFIEKLEPSTFKLRGGDRSVSDLKNILHTVLEKVDDQNAAILISDFVFSPGSNNNAQDYLNNQQVGIRIDFAEKLKKTNLSAAVIQLDSNFDGNYYDKNNQIIPIKAKRPYYIWVFGTTQQVKTLIDKKMLDNIKGGYRNRIIFISLKEPASVEYKILYRPRTGEFKLENGAKGGITEAEISQDGQTKGVFGFTLAVNFSGSMHDQVYYSDAGNYRLSNSNYNLTVEPVTAQESDLRGFTHKLKLQTKELKDETLKIDVIGKIPTWVMSSTSTDDANIATDDTEKQKTFGLRYLIEGVNDAFYPQSSENIINTLNISIRK